MFGLINSMSARDISLKSEKRIEKENQKRFNKIYKKCYKRIDNRIFESALKGNKTAYIKLEIDVIDVKELMNKLKDELVDKGYQVSTNEIWWGYGDSLGYELVISWQS